MKNIIENEVGAILTDILDDYKKGRAVDKMDIYNQPDKTEIMDILDRLFSIVYPGFFRDKTHKIYNIEHSVSTMIEDVMFHLNKQICVVLKYTKEFGDNEEEKLEQFAQKATVSFMRRIPKVREYLETDLQAAYDGDPAARKSAICFAFYGKNVDMEQLLAKDGRFVREQSAFGSTDSGMHCGRDGAVLFCWSCGWRNRFVLSSGFPIQPHP